MKTTLIWILVACALSHFHVSLSEQAGPAFDATVSFSGSYAIRVRGKQWFASAQPFLVVNGTRYSHPPGNFPGQVPAVDAELKLQSQRSLEGADVLGAFRGMRWTYFAGDTRMDAEVRVYTSAVVFSQTFPYGLKNASVPDDRPLLSGFPAFDVNFVFTTYTADGYLTFNGQLAGNDSVFLAKWDPINTDIPMGIMASGPLCLFNSSSNDAVVISPLTQTMHVSPMYYSWEIPHIPSPEGKTYWGLDRDLTSLPPGFKAEVVMVHSSSGIGKAMEDWGAMYRKYNQPESPAKPQQRSVALDKLGYWTGQGSYYYGNTTEDRTYADILLDVKKTANNSGVPLGFFELDNWWYNSVNHTPPAVVTWEANNQSLPSGLQMFQEELGLPLAAVMGFWSSSTPYAEQNNGSYAFLIEDDYALPMEKEFWEDLFKNASQNNIKHVILDDMAAQYLGVTALLSEAGLASDWLRNISMAAGDAGVTLTLSQALPRMVLEASQYPAVVQVRVSAPYLDGYDTNATSNQWQVGVASLLPRALGLAAFKGTFWTHVTEPGNPYDLAGVEPNPTLQAVVATLSTGFMVLGDGKDFVASDIIHRCCRSDGVVLRPTQPAAAVNAQLIRSAMSRPPPGGIQVWAALSTTGVFTYQNVTSSYAQGVILKAGTTGAFNVTPADAFPGVMNMENVRAWWWGAGREAGWGRVSADTPLHFPSACSLTAAEPARPCLLYLSPPLIINQGTTVVHLGGEDKFVPLSPQRLRAINVTIGVTLTLQGQPGERVSMFYYVNDIRRTFNVTIDTDGVSDVVLNVVAPPLTTKAPVTSEGPTSEAPMTSLGPGGGAARLCEAVSMSVALSVVLGFVLVHMSYVK